MEKHSSDSDIQEYVFNKDECDSTIVNHINACKVCQQAAMQYQLLFNKVVQEPKFSFDFDVTDLVSPHLAPIKPKVTFDYFPVFISGACVLFGLGFIAYLQGNNFRAYWKQLNLWHLFSEIPMIQYLLITTAVTVLFFALIDIHKNFQKKLEMLSTF